MRTIEKFFDVLVRQNGEVVIVLQGRLHPPYLTPEIEFNGEDLAVLYRDEQEDIYLTAFSSWRVKWALRRVRGVRIIELDPAQNILHSYSAEVIRVRSDAIAV